jgi:hypothetical protein
MHYLKGSVGTLEISKLSKVKLNSFENHFC